MAGTYLGGRKNAAHAAGLTLAEYQDRESCGLHRCNLCSAWKPRVDFSNDKTRADGCSKKCHDCVRTKNPRTDQLFKQGQSSAFKGRSHSSEAIEKMRVARKGNKSRLGKKHTPETRARIAAITRERTARGATHYAYSDGKSQRNLSLRRTPEYSVWRTAVFERDGYRCRDCGDDRGGNLRAHHEKPMGQFSELAYSVGNGTTLCHPCHELRHFKPDSIRNQRKVKRGQRLWK